MTALNSKWKHENLGVIVHVQQTTQNFVISLCYFAKDGKDMFLKIHNARTQLLFCSLILLFGSVLVAVVVVVCLTKFPIVAVVIVVVVAVVIYVCTQSKRLTLAKCPSF